tara:strand:+ start:800 stop:937 length:138 start_codon:yes stop_codon:yes gene_type:complete
MPFEVRKVGNLYGVYNLAKKQFTKKRFKTREAAQNMIKVWLKWDK